MEPSFRAKLVERRTYSRPKGDGTFETWDEIIDRVIGHQKWLWSNAQGGDLNQAQKKELGDLKTLLLNRQVMLAGRTLWLGGTDVAKRRQATNFNCSFLRIKTIHDVVDAYWLLMQGCGVGFEPITGVLSGFNRPCNDVEIIRSRGSVNKGREYNIETYVDGLWTISVGDSAEAWVKAVGKLFAEKRPISKLVLDFSEIRVAGTRLSQYGWISSGDATIAVALPKIITLLNGASGRLLTKIEILDVMNWLGTTLSSRRSAEIALLPYHDPEADAFIDAKSGAFYNDNPQRTQSNNSVVFWTKPPKRELKGMFQTLVDNGGAEPGFINGNAAYIRGKYFAGFNPCAEIILGDKSFCVSGDTPLILNNGIAKIKDVVNKEVSIFNGKEWTKVTPFKASNNEQLYKVSFGDGSYLNVTANHRFFVKDRFGKSYVEKNTIELLNYKGHRLHTEPFTMTKVGGKNVEHAYSIGFYVGDGYGNNITIYNENKRNLPLAGVFSPRNKPAIGAIINLPFDWNYATTLKYNINDIFSWSEDSILNWVSGLADADGSNAAKGIRIYQANEDFCRTLQLLLTSVGIKSSVNFMAAKGTSTNLSKRLNDVWYVQITDTKKLRCHRLTVGNINTSNKGKTQTIISVVPASIEDSYCFTEPKTGKGVFNNSLTGQCNLVEVNLPSFNGNWVALHDAVRLVARANYRQTCVDLRDGVLQASWHELNDFLRLTGVSLTGIMEWEHRDNPRALEQLREIAKGSVAVMAHELDLPPSQNTTTVKPSGTLSKLMDTTEGIHKPLGKYIFNNINFSKDDPLIELCRRAGYKVFDNPLSTDGVLVTVPVKYEDCGFTNVNGTMVNNDSAIDQLERYKRMMLHYVDHNCSNTISYSPDEVPAIVDWLDKNWDTYVGVSWLFRNDPTKRAVDLGFAYLPQEVVTKEEYESYKSTLKEVNFNNQLGSEDLSMVDDGCATGACPIR